MKKNIKRAQRTVLLTIILASTSSCALVFQGSRKEIPIRSMTQDSKIYVDGQFKGTDAVSVKMRRNSNHTVMVKKDGFKTQTITIEKHAQAGWIVFDALINWGAFLTDPTTGAWNGLEPDNITVELEKEIQ